MKARSAVVALAVIGFVAPTAAQGSDSAGVDVSVNEVTRVDINPTTLGYGGGGSLSPKNFEPTSDDGFVGVQVENSGSNNITQASVQNSQPLSRPFGTGFAGEYDAGNFIKVRPDNTTDFTIGVGGDGEIGSTDTADGDFTDGSGASTSSINADPSKYHYGARVDFNASGPPTGTPQALTYITVPDDGSDYRYGRFREGDEEFFWVVEVRQGDTNDGNICDGEGVATGGADLFVGAKPHTDTEIGTVDFTSDNSDQFTEYDLNSEDGSGDFGIVDGVELNTTQGNTTYSVLSWCASSGETTASVASSNSGAADKTFLTRTRYDLNPFAGTTDYPTTGGLSPTGAGTGGVQRLVDGSESASGFPMHPGSSFTLFTAVEVSRGVASGQVGSGSLELVASAPEN